MHLLWLAKVEDDTIFIITLGVVLLVVISYLVLGRDDTIRLQEEEETSKTNESKHQKYVIHRLDRANDLLTSIRNSILILIVLIVLLSMLFLLFVKGCGASNWNSSAHVLDCPNTYNLRFS